MLDLTHHFLFFLDIHIPHLMPDFPKGIHDNFLIPVEEPNLVVRNDAYHHLFQLNDPLNEKGHVQLYFQFVLKLSDGLYPSFFEVSPLSNFIAKL
jgi:hypothetical protein